jgi:hypothetical protein
MSSNQEGGEHSNSPQPAAAAISVSHDTSSPQITAVAECGLLASDRHTIMKPRKPVPACPEDWLIEIAAAYRDARGATPFGLLVGQPFGQSELFHLAPAVTLKFRGLPRSGRRLGRATEAALASYVANRDDSPGVFKSPHLSFAFCYLGSHYGLGLVSASIVDDIMEYITAHRKELARLIDSSRGGVRQSF